jgi:hypothetical protein
MSVYIVAAAHAGALAGCADPYYPRYGGSQTDYSPSGYNYYPGRYGYPANYNYRSTTWDTQARL